MIKFILIAYWTGYFGFPGFSMQEFDDKQACEAVAAILNKKVNHRLSAHCEPKASQPVSAATDSK